MDASRRVVVDNSQGGDAGFVASLCASLERVGFATEVRHPSPLSMYDTAVHFVVEGVSVRVPEDFGPPELEAVAEAVRDAEAHRPSERRRVRAVPIYRGETRRVLAWVDIFGTGG